MSDDQSIQPTFVGKKNIYTCDVCYGHVVTVDVVEGVTPFLIACQSTEGCKGLMKSSMYRVFDQTMRPDLEWYRPTKEELLQHNFNTREHVAKGGLIYRKHEPKPSDLRRMKERMAETRRPWTPEKNPLVKK